MKKQYQLSRLNPKKENQASRPKRVGVEDCLTSAPIFDAPAPNTSRQNLELRLGYRIQELALGGIGRDTRRSLDALAAEVASGEPGQVMTDPRRPLPGTKLVREWNGVEHTVTVLAKGFEWQGRRFKSLSGAARAITGANWNGWKFFGFTPRPRISK